MRLHAVRDQAAAAQAAADIIERFLNEAAPAVLGVATGATMEEPFAEVVRRYRLGRLSMTRTEVYLLDEYIGLERHDPSTFANTVKRLLVQRTDLPADAVHGPDPHAADLHAACEEYERQVRSAQIGLQLLGIGTNGHIAFNEPGSVFSSTTRVVRLSQRTLADNAAIFASGTSMPATAITQGISTILAAEKLLLIACGKHKARAVSLAIEGPLSEALPASALQLHRNVTAIVDAAAASLLSEAAHPNEHSQ